MMAEATTPTESTVITIADIQRAVNTPNIQYNVHPAAGEANDKNFEAERGSLALNILCGCCLQYFKFTIFVTDAQTIRLQSAVPCGGFWGGAIGVARNNKEKERPLP